jgi:hypothetical protein
MISLAALGFAAVLSFSAPASSQAQEGNQAAEQACTPDVMRLCQELISEGNHGKIAACLKRKSRALSPECRGAMKGPGKAKHHRRHRRS